MVYMIQNIYNTSQQPEDYEMPPLEEDYEMPHLEEDYEDIIEVPIKQSDEHSYPQFMDSVELTNECLKMLYNNVTLPSYCYYDTYEDIHLFWNQLCIDDSIRVYNYLVSIEYINPDYTPFDKFMNNPLKYIDELFD